jgi:hypothetical protein
MGSASTFFFLNLSFATCLMQLQMFYTKLQNVEFNYFLVAYNICNYIKHPIECHGILHKFFFVV